MTAPGRIGLAWPDGRIHAASLSGPPFPSAELACVSTPTRRPRASGPPSPGSPRGWLVRRHAGQRPVDAVAIAAPTPAHAELCLRAARAGKHFSARSRSRSDRQATVESSTRSRRPGGLPGGLSPQVRPDWVAAADRIHAGELGEVYLFRTSLRDMTPPRPEFLAHSGGFFVDVTIHDLDTARWMGRRVAEVERVPHRGLRPRVRRDRRHRHRRRGAPLRQRRAGRDRR